MDSLKARLNNRRCHSTPPVAEGQGRLSFYHAAPAADYRPSPHLEHRLASSNAPHASPPSVNPHDPYVRYDPRAYQPVNVQSHDISRNNAALVSAPPVSIPKNSTPLLQLPRPRALWRRSLDDLSPDSPQARRAISWHEGDGRANRGTVDLASALPPEFLDLPPGYEAIEQGSNRRQPQWWADQDTSLAMSGSAGYEARAVPQIVMPETWEKQLVSGLSGTSLSASSAYTSPPQSLTVDKLLQHPLLRE
jgi:hypothetical protein